MFNNKFTKKDPVADVVSQIISERWDDDDEDDEVRRADAELKRMKAKPIEADKKTDPDKEISKLAKKTPKEVDESVEQIDELDKKSLLGRIKRGNEAEKKGWASFGKVIKHSQHGGDQKEAEKAIRNSNRYYNLTSGGKKGKTAGGFPKSTYNEESEVNEDKWTDIADGPWKKSKLKTTQQRASAAANAAGKGLKGAQHKLDVAEPKGKLTAADFKKLRKENAELQEGLDSYGFHKTVEKPTFQYSGHGQKGRLYLHDTSRKSGSGTGHMLATFSKEKHANEAAKKHNGKVEKTGLGSYRIYKEETDLQEKTLTSAESKKKEEIVKSMKKDKASLKARYGKRWKEVAYATATKSAKRVAEEIELNESHYGDMSHAAKELVLHADNDAHLYHSSHTPIMNNLRKKMKNGTYHPEKAKKLWHYHADRAAQSYAKQHGDGTPWHKMFSTSDRKAAASHWEDMHRHSLNEAKGPTSDYGLETFATNESPSTPLEKAKMVARAALSKVKNEMLGKAGATSEEIDPRIKTTDTLKGRMKGGKDDDVGPGATGRSTKVKFIPGPK